MEQKLRKYINRKFFLYPKTKAILDVREELYGIMLEEYDVSMHSGMSEEESYQRALEMMSDYKEAIREVGKGNTVKTLASILLGSASAALFYFILLTFIYLFVSTLVVDSFDKTWLILVGGAFAYFTYLSISTYRYARLFDLRILARLGIGLIFLSLIPLFYVFPSLFVFEMYTVSIWDHSWLIVLLIVLLYFPANYIAERARTEQGEY